MKHTQGEWEKDGLDITFTNSLNEKMRLAEVFGINEVAEANAKLIAAAPELLEALKMVYNNMSADKFVEEQFTQVEEAINKATK